LAALGLRYSKENPMADILNAWHAKQWEALTAAEKAEVRREVEASMANDPLRLLGGTPPEHEARMRSLAMSHALLWRAMTPAQQAKARRQAAADIERIDREFRQLIADLDAGRPTPAYIRPKFGPLPPIEAQPDPQPDVTVTVKDNLT
jgi:hypothetical protein